MLKIETFTFNPFQENTYILYNEKAQAIVIDPGCYFPAEIQKLHEFFVRAGLQPKHLLNTHCHLDHVFGEKWIAEQFNLIPEFHPLEEEILAMSKVSAEKYGVPFETYSGEINFLNEGDILTFGEDKLEVLLTPGHSPGSICFYNAKQSFIIGGDVLFRESIGRTDLYKGDYEQLIRSIKDKIFVLPEDTTIYPGHGVKTSIGYEKRNNPFLKENV